MQVTSDNNKYNTVEIDKSSLHQNSMKSNSMLTTDVSAFLRTALYSLLLVCIDVSVTWPTYVHAYIIENSYLYNG